VRTAVGSGVGAAVGGAAVGGGVTGGGIAAAVSAVGDGVLLGTGLEAMWKTTGARGWA